MFTFNRIRLAVLTLILFVAAIIPAHAQSQAVGGGEPEQPKQAVSPTGEQIEISDSLANSQTTVDEKGNKIYYTPEKRGKAKADKPNKSSDRPDDPNASDPSPNRVIGGDERIKVGDTTKFPYSAIADIRFTQNGKSYSCTGWIYDDNYVATAGHCILSRDGYWSTNIVVYPGRNGSSKPYGSCGSVNIFVSDLWQRDRNSNYDYGTIRMDCTIGTKTGTLGLRYNSNSWVDRFTTLTGYHGDKDSHTTQWYTVKAITQDTGTQLFYQHDMTGGASGAPIYFTESGCGQCVIAVNASEYDNQDNSGPRMTQGMYNFYNSLR